MKSKLLFIILACVLFLQTINATVYYVRSAGGSDTNNGLTVENAFASLNKAFSGSPTLANGDIINISGTFDYAVNKSVAATITIQGSDKSSSFIQGLSTSISKCFTVATGGNLTIENVTFRNFNNFDAATTKTAGVIYLMAGSSLTCRNVDFLNNKSTQGGAIDIAAGGTVVNLEDCYFFQNHAYSTTGSSNAQGGAININHGTSTVASDITINRCLFEKNTSKASGSAIFFKAGDNTNPKLLILNSTFAENAQDSVVAAGGTIQVYTGACATDDIKLVNNTIAYNTSLNSTSTARPGLYYTGAAATAANRLTLINNIFAFNTDGASVSKSITNSYLLKETRNNITDAAYGFWSQTTGNLSSGCLSSVTAEQLGLAASLAGNGGANKTLMISDNSVAANAGYSTGAPSVDQRNLARIGVPDVGAYESSKTTVLVRKNSENQIIIYQSKNTICFKNIEDYKQLMIFTIDGKIVSSNAVLGNELTIKKTPGILFIKLIGNNTQTESIKLQIQQ